MLFEPDIYFPFRASRGSISTLWGVIGQFLSAVLTNNGGLH